MRLLPAIKEVGFVVGLLGFLGTVLWFAGLVLSFFSEVGGYHG